MLDLQYILSIYLNRTYGYLKTIRLCANTYVKGVFTSDKYYEPGTECTTATKVKTWIVRYALESVAGMDHTEAKKLGLVEKGIEALPREMAFPIRKSENWHEKYDLIR